MCAEVSCPHPDFLLELLTHRQLVEWAEYLAIEPRGFIADDARHATLLATIARIAGSKTAKPADFTMAQPEPVVAAVSEREKFERMVGIVARAEAKAERPRRKRK